MKQTIWVTRLKTSVGEYEVRFTADERDAVKAGGEALRVLQTTRTRSWGLWLVVGDALLLLRDKVKKATGAPRPVGKIYNQTFSDLMSRFGLVMDGGTRTRLFELLENRQEVEEWRAKDPQQARKLTHPISVWRAWKKRQSELPT
jgi:hypothetical protein